MKCPREVLKQLYDQGYEDGQSHRVPADLKTFSMVFEEALSDLSEIVTGICKEESFKWKDVKADNKFGVGVRAGIEAIEFRLSELFTAKEHTKKGETQ